MHYHEKRLPEALDAAEEASKFSERDNSLVNQAINSYLLGRILFSANRDTEAWKYMEISLTKNLELGDRRESAGSLEYMGYGYLRRGDYLKAYSAYEAAADSYIGTVDEEPDGTTCKDNMAKIKGVPQIRHCHSQQSTLHTPHSHTHSTHSNFPVHSHFFWPTLIFFVHTHIVYSYSALPFLVG